MASITLGGNLVNTNGDIPSIGSIAPNFTLTATDLTSKSLSDYGGVRKILNIFPSVGTGVCSASVRKFNEEASKLNNTKVLCISKDLPFAQTQFCAAEGIANVEMLSDFKNDSFSKEYGVLILNGIFEGLLARVVIILDENNKVMYSEQVPEISNEPDYASALKQL
jgi:thioredoxin-dependent peroxiredoxin